jgi:hypothetical protein
MLDYKVMADNDSLYNTPPCWTIYVCGLVFQHLLRNGGLEAAQKRNAAKAKVCFVTWPGRSCCRRTGTATKRGPARAFGPSLGLSLGAFMCVRAALLLQGMSRLEYEHNRPVIGAANTDSASSLLQ